MTPHDRAERDIDDVVAAGRFLNPEVIPISAFHTTHLSSIGLDS